MLWKWKILIWIVYIYTLKVIPVVLLNHKRVKKSVEYLSVSPYYGNRQYIRVIEYRTQKHIVLWAHISLSLLGPRSSIDYKRLWKRILQKYMRWGWKIYITINKALYKRNNSIRLLLNKKLKLDASCWFYCHWNNNITYNFRRKTKQCIVSFRKKFFILYICRLFFAMIPLHQT